MCVNTSSCEGMAEFLNCENGMYHAGCDQTVKEGGWCEPCPIQSALDCPAGFFLNFECTNTSTLSSVPNECIPCNRVSCGRYGRFPTKNDCGDPAKLSTMLADTIECSQLCSEPDGDEWVERPCQYFE